EGGRRPAACSRAARRRGRRLLSCDVPKGNCSPGVTHSQHHSLDLVCSHSYRTLLPPVARSRRLQPSAPMVAKVGVCLLLSPPLTLGEKKVKATHEIEAMVNQICVYPKNCFRRKYGTQETGSALVAWDTVSKPKSHGGLGILDITTHNKALLMKFLHKFLKVDNPWVNIIWETHYQDTLPGDKMVGSF
uniref:Uncharacterized protein n=2 Tax=Aegilops tauschii subsp. strangulata TaxID=200361 RepID=A0A452YLJ0_AEGTS